MLSVRVRRAPKPNGHEEIAINSQSSPTPRGFEPLPTILVWGSRKLKECKEREEVERMYAIERTNSPISPRIRTQMKDSPGGYMV